MDDVAREKKERKIKASLFELPSSCQRGCMKVFRVRASSRALFIKDTDGADDRMQAGDFHSLFSLVCCVGVIGATPSAKTLDVASLISTESSSATITAPQLRSGFLF